VGVDIDLDFDLEAKLKQILINFISPYNESNLKNIFEEIYEVRQNILLQKIDELFDNLGANRGFTDKFGEGVKKIIKVDCINILNLSLEDRFNLISHRYNSRYPKIENKPTVELKIIESGRQEGLESSLRRFVISVSIMGTNLDVDKIIRSLSTLLFFMPWAFHKQENAYHLFRKTGRRRKNIDEIHQKVLDRMKKEEALGYYMSLREAIRIYLPSWQDENENKRMEDAIVKREQRKKKTNL
jgi:hypothetical protein